jgi:hypothetical protein
LLPFRTLVHLNKLAQADFGAVVSVIMKSGYKQVGQRRYLVSTGLKPLNEFIPAFEPKGMAFCTSSSADSLQLLFQNIAHQQVKMGRSVLTFAQSALRADSAWHQRLSFAMASSPSEFEEAMLRFSDIVPEGLVLLPTFPAAIANNIDFRSWLALARRSNLALLIGAHRDPANLAIPSPRRDRICGLGMSPSDWSYVFHAHQQIPDPEVSTQHQMLIEVFKSRGGRYGSCLVRLREICFWT